MNEPDKHVADARLRAENEALRANLIELRDRISELHAQLGAPRQEVVTFRMWLRGAGRRWIQRLDGLIFGHNR